MTEYVVASTQDFGEALRAARGALSQAELADSAHVTRSHLGSLESWGKDITLSRALRLMSVTDYEVVVRRKEPS